MHPALIGISLALLILYGIIWRTNTPTYGRVIVFKSKWFHSYRYTIRVTEYNNLRVVLWNRCFWSRDVIESTKIDTGSITEMYKSAHQIGQELLTKKTSSLVKKELMVKFGKDYAKKMNEVVTVSKKLELI